MTYAETRAALRGLKRRYPEAVRLHSIGETLQGRMILLAQLGRENAPKHILVQASIHAREYGTSQILLRQAAGLLRRGINPGVCWHIIPMANPDGVEISIRRAKTPYLVSLYNEDPKGKAAGVPLEAYLRRWKANARGVDLNRNFPACFERVEALPAPAAEGYKGAYAASEPETRALMRYADSRRFTFTLSYHAAGRELYYEFCPAPNDPLKAVGALLANAAGKTLAERATAVNGYAVLPDSGNSFGGFKDWMIQRQGVPSLTVEFGRGPCPLAWWDVLLAYWENQRLFDALAAFL
ncbi:MAG: M14 family zinc carboxypeptidase [Eubacteriales bacterium]|nr:M14 family zinc carboxypeptidase [Eubacteriales bacterium]